VTEIDSLREDINRERRRLDEMERKLDKFLGVMQGDPAWNQKGVIGQLADVALFIETMKGFNFPEMKAFAEDWNNLKKRVLWLAGGIVGLVGFLSVVLTNLDKIQNYFHH
jgi:hypothetical protein